MLKGPDRTARTAARRRDRRTILCVDGQVGIRQMVRRGLERKRYRVMLARHGAAGLKLLLMNPGRIDVVVSDVVIPRVGQATRFLFTSPRIGGDALAVLRSRPGTAFFAKPWTISELGAPPPAVGYVVVAQHAPVAQLDRASASGAEGPAFESRLAHGVAPPNRVA